MKQCFLVALSVFLACTLATGGIVALGHRQALPARLAMLHLTDCDAPCWVGITPGETTLDEAKKLIRAAYETSNGFTVSLSFPDIGRFLRVVLEEQPQDRFTVDIEADYYNVVSAIWFYGRPRRSADRYTLGELFRLIGVPSWLLADPNDSSLLVTYGSRNSVVIYVASNVAPRLIKPSDQFQANTKINAFVYRQAAPIYGYGAAMVRLGRWRGFTALRRYGLRCDVLSGPPC